MALKFPPRSFRVGTIKDSFYSILSTIEYLEQAGRIHYQELGASPDGKVTNEFRIFPTNGMEPFAIYDYKLGVDPSDEDNFEEEFEFSIGGASKDAEESARKLGFEVVSESMEEAYHVDDTKEVVTKESSEINEDLIAKAENILKGKANLDDYLKSLKNDIRLNGEEGYADYTTDEDWEEDYENYITDKTDLDEMFIHQMKYRAGIIK